MIMQTIAWPSPAKLNLFLYITGQRRDGYHELQTLFQFLNYGDTLTIKPRQDGQINLLTPVTGVNNEKNLIVRAAHRLRTALSEDFAHCGADIKLHKQIPIGGGLGGGSSNAATMLIALNTLWQAKLSDEELASLGLSLGADVPIFVQGQAAFAEGVGEKLHAVAVKERWYLVVYPGVSISTTEIFSAPELKRNSPIRPLAQLLASPFSNNCEPIVRKRFGEVEQALSWLLQYAPSRLTGTGACVFAEFDTKPTAIQVLSNLPDWMQGFVAQGMNTSPLHLARSRLLAS